MAKITKEQIHPELRKKGIIIRWLLPCFKESTFRKANTLQNRFMKGKWSGKQSICTFMEIPRGDGSNLRLLVCSPLQKKQNVPGVLWIHGGGYAIGLSEQDVSFIERFILASDCIVVAPDYTLSTEKPYPAALNDCYLALLWMKEHAAEYGIRDDQLFVGGDSAGGGLTAALTLYARDKKEVSIAFQMPLYPMLDDRMATPSSRNNDAPVWNTKSNEAGWKLYLGRFFDTEDVPSYAAPAREVDLSGLPPACSFVGTIEPFYDETVCYMERLKTAGVPVYFREYKGCFHAFDFIVPKSTVAKDATKFLMETFDYAVQNYFAQQT